MNLVEQELEREIQAIRTMMPTRRKRFVERFGRPRNMDDAEFETWIAAAE